tara:strand:- start:11916 stop:12941 length:1026 start_codon:yes stop_codon:yes gene_type:complete
VESVDKALDIVLENIKLTDFSNITEYTMNGPHDQLETPLRWVSHCLYAMIYFTKQKQWDFSDEIDMALDYLLDPIHRPGVASFVCRLSSGKDIPNGLVGQYWILEALIYANEYLNRANIQNVIDEVLLSHHWNQDKKGWHILEPDGSCGPYHNTINQQLCFCILASKSKHIDVRKNAETSLQHLLSRIELYEDGVIFHDSKINGNYSIPDKLLNRKYRNMKIQRTRSVGYHSFVLSLLSELYKCHPDLKFWDSEMESKICEVYKKNSYLKDLNNNKYAFDYNVTGLEYGVYLYLRKGVLPVDLLGMQLQVNVEAMSSSKKKLYLSRLYEVVKLKELLNERN